MGLSLASDKYKIKWTKCNDLPVAMREAYATIIEDVIFIGGGDCPDDNDCYYIFMYHLKENKWTRLPARLPQCYCVVININSKLSVIGGLDYTTSQPTNAVLVLQAHQWTSLFGNMNVARHRPAVVSHHKHTIVAGGQSEGQVVLNTIEVFDGHQWSISKTHLPQPMWYISATTSNNSLIIAGYNGANGHRFSVVYIITIDHIIDHFTTSSSTDDNKWITLANTPRWSTTIVPHTTPPVIVGGQDNRANAIDEIMIYDDSTNCWKTVSSLPIRCCSSTILSLPHTIMIAGGCTDVRTKWIARATSLTSVMIGELVEKD